jgi:hypothetical protein
VSTVGGDPNSIPQYRHPPLCNFYPSLNIIILKLQPSAGFDPNSRAETTPLDHVAWAM